MRALRALTIANVRSFVRDRAALFWTLAFPLDLHLPVRVHLPGQRRGRSRLSRGSTRMAVARIDAAPGRVRGGRGVDVTDEDRRCRHRVDAGLARSTAIIVVPAGYGAGRSRPRRAGPARPAQIEVYTDPSRQQLQGSVYQAVGSVLGIVNLGGRPPMVVPIPQTVQTENLNFISYFVPSILALSVMQLGIFAAVPLVADREKGILKRLSATPLPSLAAGRVQHPDAAADRAGPDDHHRRRWAARSSACRSAARFCWRRCSWPSARVVPRAGLRPGLVHQDRRGGQRHDPGRSSSR